MLAYGKNIVLVPSASRDYVITGFGHYENWSQNLALFLASLQKDRTNITERNRNLLERMLVEKHVQKLPLFGNTTVGVTYCVKWKRQPQKHREIILNPNKSLLFKKNAAW